MPRAPRRARHLEPGLCLFVVSLLGLVSCSPKLAIPEEAEVACAADRDCPSGLVCASAARECVDPALRVDSPLRLQSTIATSATNVTLVFDRAVVLHDGALAAFSITPALAVLSVERAPDDESRVLLRTEEQRGQQEYTVQIGGLTDVFGGPLPQGAHVDTFTGFGPGPDGSPPSFIFPAAGEQFGLGVVRVVWSGLPLVTTYELEVWAQDPDLPGAVAPAATYSTAAPITNVDITLAEATTHWLRLRSDATRAGEYAELRIEAVGDTLYVYCPADDTTCDDAGTGGNLASPRRSVARAIEDAHRLGASTVLVAARGVPTGGTDMAAYSETFDIYANLTLRGGYDASFAEGARDPVANRTIVASTESTVMRCTAVKTTPQTQVVVEGLELVSQSDNPSSVVSFVNCDDGVTLTGNVIRNLGTNDSRTGVFMQSSKPDGAPGPTIVGNQIYSGLGVQVVGVNTEIRDNAFFTGGIPEAGGVFVTGGLVRIEGNSIDVAATTSGGYVAIYVLQLNPFNGRVDVVDNTITVAGSARASDGVILVNADGDVVGNTIETGAAPFSVGVLLESNERINEARAWTVSDNTFDIGVGNGSYGTSAAVYISDRGDRVDALVMRNRGVVAGLDSASGGVTAGVYVGSEAGIGERSDLRFVNNALSVGPAALGIGAGAYVYLLGAAPKLAFVHNTLRYASTSRAAFPQTPTAGGVLVTGNDVPNLGLFLVNNLVVGPGGVQPGPAFYSQELSPTPVIDHNLVVGVERFAHFPNASGSPFNDASGTGCNTAYGDGNLGNTSPSLDEASDLALGGDDGLAPTSTSPTALLSGGMNTLVASCGGANNQPCGGVADDVTGAGRTCAPPFCTSIGAYEVD